MDIMIKPVVTEKANAVSEKLNRYTFKVSPSANKFQIKSLVESPIAPRSTIAQRKYIAPRLPL